MAIENDSVAQNCYQEYLIAKYVTSAQDDEKTIVPQYNTVETEIGVQPMFIRNGE